MTNPEPEVLHLSKRVDPYHDGWTLLDFLCHRFRYLSRETWMERIEAGQLRVDGVPAAADTVLRRKSMVEYEVHIVEPPVDFRYSIIHEDADILVVSKSGNIPVHAAGGYIRNTLISRLKDDLGPDLALAHRLDRETSGLVVLTRTTQSARVLAEAFAHGEVEKSYLAIVHGEPRETEFTVDAPVSKDWSARPMPRMVVERRGGKPATTRFRVVERAGVYSVLEARPKTGRTNQIRLHLESAGHPIVGDKIYGMPPDLLEESIARPESERVRRHLVLARHALHAWKISLRHPTQGGTLSLEAPIPDDMETFIRRTATGKSSPAIWRGS